MTINTALCTAQSGDYSAIAGIITLDDAIAFNAIYQALVDHALVSKKIDSEDAYTITDYVQSRIEVNLSEEGLDIASISTLKAAGLIITNDSVHIGLTLLGLGFYDFMQI
jgi:hypothetical protein